MKTNQKGIIQIFLILGITLALGAIIWVLATTPKDNKISEVLPVPSGYQNSYSEGANEIPSIDNTSDFQTVSASLDTVSTAEMDAELQKLDSDISSF
jgi:hypothetical protein